MKKIYLVAVFAIIALACNAERKSHALKVSNKAIISKVEKLTKNNLLNLKEIKNSASFDAKEVRTAFEQKKANKLAKAQEVTSNKFLGKFVEDCYDDEYEYYPSSKVTISEKEDKGSDGNTYTYYNLVGAYEGYSEECLGSLFEEDELFVVWPGQTIMTITSGKGLLKKTYELYIVGYQLTEEKGSFQTANNGENLTPLYYYASEDENGVYYSLVTGEDAGYDGWCVLAQNTKDDDDHGIVAMSTEHIINKTNAIADFMWKEINEAGTGWTDWTEVESDVYLEMTENHGSIHGMNGLITFSYDLDQTAGKVTIPNKQLVQVYSNGSEMIPFHMYAYSQDGFEAEDTYESTGVYNPENNTMVFAVPDETASDGWDWNFYCFCGNPEVTDEGVSAYWIGQCAALVCAPYEVWESGIQDVNATNEAKKGSKYFNVAGQQVGANYKGIVIKNNKKMINK